MGIRKVAIGELKKGDEIHVVRRGTVFDLRRDVDDRGDAEPIVFVVDRTEYTGSTPAQIKAGTTTSKSPEYIIHGRVKSMTGTYKIGPFHVSSKVRQVVPDPSPTVAGLILDGAKGTATLVVEIRIDGPDGRTYTVSAETEGKAEVKVI